MAKVKRSQVLTYINTTPSYPAVLADALATYELMGPGVPSEEINMNPKSTSEIYIADDSASISVDSYAPTRPVKMTAIVEDPVFTFIDQLRLDRATLGDAETTIVNVWNYETGGPTAAPAEEQIVAISIEDIGDAGGSPLEINFTISYIGTRAAGTFNTTSKVFTAS